MVIINKNKNKIAQAINNSDLYGQKNPLYEVEAITYFNQGQIALKKIKEGEKIEATETTITGEGWQILTCSVVEIVTSQGIARFPVEVGW